MGGNLNFHVSSNQKSIRDGDSPMAFPSLRNFQATSAQDTFSQNSPGAECWLDPTLLPNRAPANERRPDGFAGPPVWLTAPGSPSGAGAVASGAARPAGSSCQVGLGTPAAGGAQNSCNLSACRASGAQAVSHGRKGKALSSGRRSRYAVRLPAWLTRATDLAGFPHNNKSRPPRRSRHHKTRRPRRLWAQGDVWHLASL